MKCFLFIVLVIAYSEAKSLSCDFPCVLLYNPVCGHDGKTYSNECFMRAAACRSGEAVTIVKQGACGKCQLACTREYFPQCSHDGNVYANPCLLKLASCTSKRPIVAVQQGVGNKADCQKCNIKCTRDYRPVCGSDGQTYSNKCELRRQACIQRKPIIAVYEERCEYN